MPLSAAHGIFQARILEWVAIPFPRGSPNPGVEPASPTLAGRFLTTEPPGSPLYNVSCDRVEIEKLVFLSPIV